jgi:HrpA-like RNA helicase
LPASAPAVTQPAPKLTSLTQMSGVGKAQQQPPPQQQQPQPQTQMIQTPGYNTIGIQPGYQTQQQQQQLQLQQQQAYQQQQQIAQRQLKYQQQQQLLQQQQAQAQQKQVQLQLQQQQQTPKQQVIPQAQVVKPAAKPVAKLEKKKAVAATPIAAPIVAQPISTKQGKNAEKVDKVDKNTIQAQKVAQSEPKTEPKTEYKTTLAEFKLERAALKIAKAAAKDLPSLSDPSWELIPNVAKFQEFDPFMAKLFESKFEQNFSDLIKNSKINSPNWMGLFSLFLLTINISALQFRGLDKKQRMNVHKVCQPLKLLSQSSGPATDRVLVVTKCEDQYTRAVQTMVRKCHQHIGFSQWEKAFEYARAVWNSQDPQHRGVPEGGSAKKSGAKENDKNDKSDKNDKNNKGNQNDSNSSSNQQNIEKTKSYVDLDYDPVPSDQVLGVLDETLSNSSQQILNKLLLKFHDHLNFPLYSAQIIKTEEEKQNEEKIVQKNRDFGQQNNGDKHLDADSFDVSAQSNDPSTPLEPPKIHITGLRNLITSDMTDYSHFGEDLRDLHQKELESKKILHQQLKLSFQKLSQQISLEDNNQNSKHSKHSKHSKNPKNTKNTKNPQTLPSPNPATQLKLNQQTHQIALLEQSLKHHSEQLINPEDISLLSSHLFINPHVCSSNCSLESEDQHTPQIGLYGTNTAESHPNRLKHTCFTHYCDPLNREWSPTELELERDPTLSYHSKTQLAIQIEQAHKDRVSGGKDKSTRKAPSRSQNDPRSSKRHSAPSDPVVLGLPVRTHATRVLHALHHNNVVVVVGQTGSGKSTQIPQLIFEHFHQCKLCKETHGHSNGNRRDGFMSDNQRDRDDGEYRHAEARILCTQPRRLAAISLAQRVADERGELNHTKNEKKIAQIRLKDQLKVIKSGGGGGDLLDDNDNNNGGDLEFIGIDNDDDLGVYDDDHDDDLLDPDDDNDDFYKNNANTDENDDFEIDSDVEVDDSDDKNDQNSSFSTQQGQQSQNKDEEHDRVVIDPGSVVGYAVKGQNRNPHANIVFCTSGLFLRRITTDTSRPQPQSQQNNTFNNRYSQFSSSNQQPSLKKSFATLSHFNPLFSKWMKCHDDTILLNSHNEIRKAQDIDGVNTDENGLENIDEHNIVKIAPKTKQNQLKTLSNKAMALFTSVFSPFVHKLLFALRKYTHIIIDEAHERDKLIDFTLVLLKVALLVRKDLKVVIMSATINSSLFSDYFNAPIINIEGRTFPVDVFYLHHSILLSEMALENHVSLYNPNVKSDQKNLTLYQEFLEDSQLYISALIKKENGGNSAQAQAATVPTAAAAPGGKKGTNEIEFSVEDFPPNFTRYFACKNNRKYSAEMLTKTLGNVQLKTVSDEFHALSPPPQQGCGPLCPCYLTAFPLSTCVNVLITSYDAGKISLKKTKGGSKQSNYQKTQPKPDIVDSFLLQDDHDSSDLPIKPPAGRVNDTVKVLEGLLGYITNRQVDEKVLDKCLRGIVLGSNAADGYEQRENDRRSIYAASLMQNTKGKFDKKDDAKSNNNNSNNSNNSNKTDNNNPSSFGSSQGCEFQSTGSIDELSLLLGDMSFGGDEFMGNTKKIVPNVKPTPSAPSKLQSLTSSTLKDIKAVQITNKDPQKDTVPQSWDDFESIVSEANKHEPKKQPIQLPTAAPISQYTPETKTYPVRDRSNDIYYLEREKLPFGAILIFVAGWSDITTVSEFLLKHPVFGSDKYSIIPLHSTVPLDQQQLAFELPSVEFSNGVSFDSDDIKEFYSAEQIMENQLNESILARKKNDNQNSPLILTQSELQLYEKLKSRPRPVDPRWKIIVSTNIAETSLTISDCLYVFDFGCHKEKIYNAAADFSSFGSTFISQSNCSQRSGRAGRVRHGYSFRFYDLQTFGSFPSFPKPEVLTTSIEDLVLSTSLLTLTSMERKPREPGNKIKISAQFLRQHQNYLKQLSFYQQHQVDLFGNSSVETFLRSKRWGRKNHTQKEHKYNCAQFLSLMPQPPPLSHIVKAIHSLQQVNALDSHEHPTVLSAIYNIFPLPPRLTRLLILSLLYGCFDHGLTAVSVLTSPPVFVGRLNPNAKISLTKQVPPEQKGRFSALDLIEYDNDGIMINAFKRNDFGIDLSNPTTDSAEEQSDVPSMNCFVHPSIIRQLLSNSTGSDVIASIHGFYAWLAGGQAYSDRRLFARNLGIAHSACITIAQTRKQLFELVNSHPVFHTYLQAPMQDLDKYQTMAMGGPEHVGSMDRLPGIIALSERNNDLGGGYSNQGQSRPIIGMNYFSKLVIHSPCHSNFVPPSKTQVSKLHPIHNSIYFPPPGQMSWSPLYYDESKALIEELPYHVLFSAQIGIDNGILKDASQRTGGIVNINQLIHNNPKHVSWKDAVNSFDPLHYRLPTYLEHDTNIDFAKNPTQNNKNNPRSAQNWALFKQKYYPQQKTTSTLQISSNASPHPLTIFSQQVPKDNVGKPLCLVNGNNLSLLAGIISTGQSFAFRKSHDISHEGVRNPYSYQQVHFPHVPSFIGAEDDTDPFSTTAPHFSQKVLHFADQIQSVSKLLRKNQNLVSFGILDHPLLHAAPKRLRRIFESVTTLNNVQTALKDISANVSKDEIGPGRRKGQEIQGSLSELNFNLFHYKNDQNLKQIVPNLVQGYKPLSMYRVSNLPLISYNECITTHGANGSMTKLVDCTPTHPLYLLFSNPNMRQIRHNYNVFHSNPYLSMVYFANYHYQHRLYSLYRHQMSQLYPHLFRTLPNKLATQDLPPIPSALYTATTPPTAAHPQLQGLQSLSPSLPVGFSTGGDLSEDVSIKIKDKASFLDKLAHLDAQYMNRLSYFYAQYSKLHDFVLTQPLSSHNPNTSANQYVGQDNRCNLVLDQNGMFVYDNNNQQNVSNNNQSNVQLNYRQQNNPVYGVAPPTSDTLLCNYLDKVFTLIPQTLPGQQPQQIQQIQQPQQLQQQPPQHELPDPGAKMSLFSTKKKFNIVDNPNQLPNINKSIQDSILWLLLSLFYRIHINTCKNVQLCEDGMVWVNKMKIISPSICNVLQPSLTMTCSAIDDGLPPSPSNRTDCNESGVVSVNLLLSFNFDKSSIYSLFYSPSAVARTTPNPRREPSHFDKLSPWFTHRVSTNMKIDGNVNPQNETFKVSFQDLLSLMQQLIIDTIFNPNFNTAFQMPRLIACNSQNNITKEGTNSSSSLVSLSTPEQVYTTEFIQFNMTRMVQTAMSPSSSTCAHFPLPLRQQEALYGGDLTGANNGQHNLTQNPTQNPTQNNNSNITNVTTNQYKEPAVLNPNQHHWNHYMLTQLAAGVANSVNLDVCTNSYFSYMNELMAPGAGSAQVARQLTLLQSNVSQARYLALEKEFLKQDSNNQNNGLNGNANINFSAAAALQEVEKALYKSDESLYPLILGNRPNGAVDQGNNSVTKNKSNYAKNKISQNNNPINKIEFVQSWGEFLENKSGYSPYYNSTSLLENDNNGTFIKLKQHVPTFMLGFCYQYFVQSFQAKSQLIQKDDKNDKLKRSILGKK